MRNILKQLEDIVLISHLFEETKAYRNHEMTEFLVYVGGVRVDVISSASKQTTVDKGSEKALSWDIANVSEIVWTSSFQEIRSDPPRDSARTQCPSFNETWGSKRQSHPQPLRWQNESDHLTGTQHPILMHRALTGNKNPVHHGTIRQHWLGLSKR